MNQNTSIRLYYLDGLRSFLIVLVVLVHCSQVYNPSHTWNIYSENGSEIANFIVGFLGLLIMPTFFMIAGYFAVISLKHAHGTAFLLKRLIRLVVPLVTILLTLNLFQSYLLVEFGWKNWTQIFTNAHWLSHLWFLINLIVYTIVSYLFVTYFETRSRNILLYISEYLEKKLFFKLFFIIPISYFALLVIFKFTPAYVLGININQIIFYMPYFIFGVLLSLNNSLLNKYSNIPLYISSFVVIISYSLMKQFETTNVIEYKILYHYSKAIAIWFFASFAFSFFKRYFNKKSLFAYKISDASYTIYLVHHVLVITIGLLFIQLNFSFIYGLPMLFLFSILISYYFHSILVSKYAILQLLVNGKYVKK